jgi:hypothetical protein
MIKKKKSCREKIESLGQKRDRRNPMPELFAIVNKQVIATGCNDSESIEVVASTTATLEELIPEIKEIYECEESRREVFTAEAKERAKEKRNEREIEWGKWRDERDRIVTKHPHLAGNKSELGRRVIKNLDLNDELGTVRKKL